MYYEDWPQFPHDETVDSSHDYNQAVILLFYKIYTCHNLLNCGPLTWSVILRFYRIYTCHNLLNCGHSDNNAVLQFAGRRPHRFANQVAACGSHSGAQLGPTAAAA